MPYCTHCGTEEQANQRFCPVCGVPTGGSPGVSPMPRPGSGEVRSEAHVHIGLSLDPPCQARWSILFRFILCLPLFFVAAAVAFAAFFVTVAAWFCALFTGRVSDGLQVFLTSALRLYVNILAYQYLLVPRWPGITFHQRPSDQVTVAVDHVGLRRWSAFFRFILSYPANLVSALLTLGTYPLLVVMWVWGLVAGRAPRPLHQALALVLRYQMRLQAYVCLLTPTQPFRGLFGDGVVTSSTAPTAPDVPSATPPSLVAPGVAPGATPSLPTYWFVERVTKTVLVIAIVLGVLTYALTLQVERPFLTRVEARVARSVLNSSHLTAVDALATFDRAVKDCSVAEFQGCASAAATRAHERLDQIVSSAFIYALVPPSARSEELLYASALEALDNEMASIQTSPSAQSQQEVISVELPTTLANLNHDYEVFERGLDKSA